MKVAYFAVIIFASISVYQEHQKTYRLEKIYVPAMENLMNRALPNDEHSCCFCKKSYNETEDYLSDQGFLLVTQDLTVTPS